MTLFSQPQPPRLLPVALPTPHPINRGAMRTVNSDGRGLGELIRRIPVMAQAAGMRALGP